MAGIAARSASSPSGPASSASRGSHSVTSGCELRPLGFAYIGKVGDDQIESVRPPRQRRLDQLDPPARPSRSALAPATSRAAGRGVGRDHLALRQLGGDRQRDRA